MQSRCHSMPRVGRSLLRGVGVLRCRRLNSEPKGVPEESSERTSNAYHKTEAVELKKTVLHDFHVAQGGRMVEFAGWSMPVQYSNLSIINSTLHTRQHASLFDVSHMLQLEVSGSGAEQFLESVMVADLKSLHVNTGTLSVLTTDNGGIIDDLIVTRTGEQSFYVVANAGCADKDMAHLMTSLDKFNGGSVSLTPLDDKSLIAYQGPEVVSLLEELGLSSLSFMSSATVDVYGVQGCRVTRCGYTGEDGVEISVPTLRAVELAEKLGAGSSVAWAGLGARDILRLEAGLCLYGSDITETTTPVEAGLAWCISKRRRKEEGFPGSDTILAQLRDKPARRRVGFVSHAGPPPRSGAVVIDLAGNEVGQVTSGCHSPCLKTNIAMAYVPRAISGVGRTVKLRVRARTVVEAEITKMPFVTHQYYSHS